MILLFYFLVRLFNQYEVIENRNVPQRLGTGDRKGRAWLWMAFALAAEMAVMQNVTATGAKFLLRQVPATLSPCHLWLSHRYTRSACGWMVHPHNYLTVI